MPDEIRLRNNGLAIDPEMELKCNHVSLLVHDNHGKVVTIGHPQQYLPGGKVNNGETPLEALLRIGNEQLGVDFNGMEKYMHPIFCDFIGYPCNKNVSMCYAVFDKDDATLIHDCRIPTNRDNAAGQYIGRLDSLFILTLSKFSQYHEYYGKLRKRIQQNEMLLKLMEHENVH